MIDVIAWYLCLTLLGWIMIPFTVLWGKDLVSKGIMLSKLLAVLFLSLFSWLFSNFHFLPFTQVSLLLIILTGVFANTFLIKKHDFSELFSKNTLKNIIFAELLFFVPFALWTYLRTFNPNIDNFEKFMDMNILSSLLRTEYFPPQDTWFAGETINYYYFGHLIAATLTKLTGVANDIGYNLATPTVFAFSFTTAFTLVASVVKKLTSSNKTALATGILGPLLVNFAGSLYTFSFLFKETREAFWYWSAIRLIPNAIHEMPAYSFAVADLHAHMLNIPHVLLALINIYLLVSTVQKKTINIHAYMHQLIVTGLILGIIIMTSAWDFPMYLGITGLGIFTAYFIKEGNILASLVKSIRDAALIMLTTIFTTFLFFKYFDSSIAGGVGVVHAHTSPLHFLILWGPYLLIFLPVLVLFVTQIALPIFTKHTKISTVDKSKNQQSSQPGNLFLQLTTNIQAQPIFLTITLLFGLWGLFLLLIPEIIYLKDIYGADMHRLNTILKFYYQAFIILSVTSAILVGYAFTKFQHPLWKVWKVLVLLILIPLLAFPFQIIPDYNQDFAKQTNLNGKQFMEFYLAEDKMAINWINQNIEGQPVMVEAPGDSYTHSNRISTFTGLPTVVGWFVHEWLWRGSPDKPGDRNTDVATLYQNPSLVEKQKIIDKYDVEYIYLGKMEKEKYPGIDETLLMQLGNPIYESAEVKIIHVFENSQHGSM